MYEGVPYQGLRIDGKKGKFSLKVTMWDGSYENLEFDKREYADDAQRKAGLAGCHSLIHENTKKKN